MNEFIAPKYGLTSFCCAHCGVLSQQIWSTSTICSYRMQGPNGTISSTYNPSIVIAKCTNCGNLSIWIDQKMIYPIIGNVENANSDMPLEIQQIYNEAKSIVNLSSRGAAALLRLALQKLCVFLGEKGSNLNDDIKKLVDKGLPTSIQQALDSVRVIGNNAVHPGVIDLTDNSDITYSLFGFLNIICDILISQPKKIKEYYEKNIPQNMKEYIEKRDSQ
jgi:hypothetical protein